MSADEGLPPTPEQPRIDWLILNGLPLWDLPDCRCQYTIRQSLNNHRLGIGMKSNSYALREEAGVRLAAPQRRRLRGFSWECPP